VSYVPKDSPKAVLIFHHGYGEHTGRYDYGAPTVQREPSPQV
jgi:alpha-beta hydrolase superfamily lysophospholipase